MSRVDAKIVLLGKSYVGKTCLVNRYIHHRFDAEIPYQNTIGAAFGSKKEMVNGKPLNLGIWDTAGHERYESMTRMYYRSAVACILCYDITDKSSFDRIRFWAGELQATEPACRIYLCGTKKDIVDDYPGKRQVERSTAEPLADDLSSELFETSSQTGENIDALFHKIAEDIAAKREEDARRHKEEKGDTLNLSEGENRWKFPGCSRCNRS
ncbi:ras-related protein Rab-24-like [Mya arenaria]|uniref:ras-related protein Rab-24-like n=1 Tax=Mya arenaria TaxID=6604 RepID=UPI0022E15E1E|nr:ras-related protein Rab-24-like [Mya arenaria]XP_052772675.1 ras-related protein Rab-24-like [Mya arenaria]